MPQQKDTLQQMQNVTINTPLLNSEIKGIFSHRKTMKKLNGLVIHCVKR